VFKHCYWLAKHVRTPAHRLTDEAENGALMIFAHVGR
jgi:hypothetical protein